MDQITCPNCKQVYVVTIMWRKPVVAEHDCAKCGHRWYALAHSAPYVEPPSLTHTPHSPHSAESPSPPDPPSALTGPILPSS
jgi:hypothetical protein